MKDIWLQVVWIPWNEKLCYMEASDPMQHEGHLCRRGCNVMSSGAPGETGNDFGFVEGDMPYPLPGNSI